MKITEFENFDRTMQQLLRVPHSELKEKLDAEKAQKAAKKRKSKTSASDRVSRDKD